MYLKKSTLLKKMQYRRQHWNNLIDVIMQQGLQNDMVSDTWNFRDVIAHIVWYERELLDALTKRSIVDSEFWNMDYQQRNDMIFQKTQDSELNDLLEEMKRNYDKIVQEIEQMTEDQLNSEDYIARRKGTRVTQDFIGGITFWHYEDHEDALIDRFELDYQY